MHFRNLAKIATAALLSIVLIPATAVAANSNVSISFSNPDTVPITGTAKLSQTLIKNKGSVSDNGKTYDGTLQGEVDAKDLFDDAYTMYKDHMEKKFVGPFFYRRPVKNFIMYDNGEKFPTMHLKVKFPTNFTVNKDNIEATANTSIISEVSHIYDSANNTVDITYKLGNWNDYEGFFKLVEAERNSSNNHPLKLSIPYSVKLDDKTEQKLGDITLQGDCHLYKYGRLNPKGTPILDITSTMTIPVNKR